MRIDLEKLLAWCAVTLMGIILVILMATMPSSGQDTSSRITAEAQAKLGTRVGLGNCRHFVNRILKETGTTIGPADTVPHEAVMPGDIFLTAGFYRVTSGDIYDNLEGIGAHTAIVLTVLGNNRYEIIEQNTEGKKVSIRIIDITVRGYTRDYGTYFLRPRTGDHNKAAKKFLKYQYQH